MPYQNRIAALRKQWMLSQDELASLLGMTRANVSRMEVHGGACTIDTALLLECLFGVPMIEIFPQLYETLHETLAGRLATFSLSVNEGTDAASNTKRDLLSQFASRAASFNLGV
jgi:DNA-binding XRE family transcriptional regulator